MIFFISAIQTDPEHVTFGPECYVRPLILRPMAEAFGEADASSENNSGVTET